MSRYDDWGCDWVMIRESCKWDHTARALKEAGETMPSTSELKELVEKEKLLKFYDDLTMNYMNLYMHTTARRASTLIFGGSVGPYKV